MLRKHIAASPNPPSAPRLRMEPTGAHRTLLDGGWWPESTTPAKNTIAAAMQRNAQLEPLAIHVDVNDHQLTLRGMVRSFAEYRQAERTAWNAAGVTSVQNNLVIAS